MSKAVKRESPLVQASFASGLTQATQLREKPFLGYVNLRGLTSDEAFLNAAASVLGAGLPQTPNTVVVSGDYVVYWHGPSEWLIVAPVDGQHALAEQLRAALAGIHSAVTDVTGGLTLVEVKGEHAREILQKGCPMDLHPAEFGVGVCAQTVLAKAGMTLRMVDELPTFELIIRRSFSDYLGIWLLDAAREYGVVAFTQD